MDTGDPHILHITIVPSCVITYFKIANKQKTIPNKQFQIANSKLTILNCKLKIENWKLKIYQGFPILKSVFNISAEKFVWDLYFYVCATFIQQLPDRVNLLLNANI